MSVFENPKIPSMASSYSIIVGCEMYACLYPGQTIIKDAFEEIPVSFMNHTFKYGDDEVTNEDLKMVCDTITNRTHLHCSAWVDSISRYKRTNIIDCIRLKIGIFGGRFGVGGQTFDVSISRRNKDYIIS